MRPCGDHWLVMVVTRKYHDPMRKPPPLFWLMLACRRGGGGREGVIVGFYRILNGMISLRGPYTCGGILPPSSLHETESKHRNLLNSCHNNLLKCKPSSTKTMPGVSLLGHYKLDRSFLSTARMPFELVPIKRKHQCGYTFRNYLRSVWWVLQISS